MAVLETRALEKRFGRIRAVRGVSLTVERGQVYGLLGPNGSGKTTTMACALGLLRPDSGEAHVLGLPSSRIHETRGRVGALFDEATLVRGLTARQNLEYAWRLLGHTTGRGVDEALELVGLSELANQRAGGMSLGQSRRLSIARILCGSPELVVLDEPLSGLDTRGVLEVLDLFESLSESGVTVVVSSHRMHDMERVITHVGVILDGELVCESPLEELLGGNGQHIRIAASPIDRALEVLDGRDGVGAVDVLSRLDGAGELRVALAVDGVGALNSDLVAAGVEVSGLVPERATLHGVFESLLTEHAGRGSEAGGAA